MGQERRSVPGCLGLLLLLAVGCGGGSAGGAKPAAKAAWTGHHGAAVVAVGTELDLAQAALTKGDRQSILGACTLLRDDVREARKGLPVPDVGVDSVLRRALDSVDTGSADCLQAARTGSDASANEKAMAELTDSRSRLDAADQALAAWP